jgi:hypothetical protein
VRSVNGPGAAWFRSTGPPPGTRIEDGGIMRDVDFADADHRLDDEIDLAYRSKYRGYATAISDRITSPAADHPVSDAPMTTSAVRVTPS